MKEIKGVISDMDGVILDSEKLYIRFWCEAARFCGYPMRTEHALAIRSMARPLAAEKLKSFFGDDFDYPLVHSKRVELMDKYINENGIEAKPGARELLSLVKQSGLKLALATATAPDRAERYLESHDLLKYFDAIVSAHMVKIGKPAPDIYLLAAEKLGLKPCECIALEDSPNGIKSAYAAGCRVVMVPDMDEPTAQLMPLLHGVARNLSDAARFL